MQQIKILWVDDEIDQLKPFVIFLEERGYKVDTVSNGSDAVSMITENPYDLVLLDEMMPGMDGLATLREFKKINSSLPVVMVTKSEEEGLMDGAIAGQIADYLLKPINPKQIIMAIKKIIQADDIRRDMIGQEYAQFSAKLNQKLFAGPDFIEWAELYRDLCRWDLRLDEINEPNITQTHFLEKLNCNSEFTEYIMNNYKEWLHSEMRPQLSIDIVPEVLLPELGKGHPVYLIVLDCMRLDQYFAFAPMLSELFDVNLQLYYSILPTATPYSRNAIFSGLLPIDIAERFPEYWNETDDIDNSRNRNEHQLIDSQLKELGSGLSESRYVKIFNSEEANFVQRKINNWNNEELIVLVYNFLDMVAHHRSKSPILKEAIPDEKALRDFTKHWFIHSTFYTTLQEIASQKGTVIITTDHGSIRVNRASQIVGDKDTTSTVRYKQGKNLKVNSKNALLIKDPVEYGLPTRNIIDSYALTRDDYYFVYPNSFHQYQKQFSGTFQHGGISMEEMILPVVVCHSKK
ncbi:MAG: response regulator [Candidatus Cloacimonetes bacterium]|nr:response regulator [Candidatus Cloacimonadota bacterium]